MGDRLPPQDLDAERAVLSVCITFDEAVGRVQDLLQADHFYLPPHQQLWPVLVALHEARRPMDQVTLADELNRRDLLDEVGGVVFIAALAAETATAVHLETHAHIVREKAQARQLITLSERLATLAYTGHQEAQQLIDTAETALLDLTERDTTTGLVPYADIFPELVTQLEAAAQQPGQLTGVASGLSELDRMTGGWQAGDLIILAARPSMGKTALAIAFMHAAAQADRRVGFFSLEMGRGQIAQRHICVEAKVNSHRLRSGELYPEEWVSLRQKVGQLALLPIHIDETGGLSVSEVRNRARRLQREQGLDLLIIDYLQLMTLSERVQSREQEVSKLSRGLKALAKELHVPILALSQLSRKPEERTDHRPRLSDLRDSGSLEQDADVVLLIYRPEVYALRQVGLADGRTLEVEGLAEVILSKQRNGPLGSLWLAWEAEYTRFEEHPLDQVVVSSSDDEADAWPNNN